MKLMLMLLMIIPQARNFQKYYLVAIRKILCNLIPIHEVCKFNPQELSCIINDDDNICEKE